MPQTAVVFYREKEGAVPVLEWLDNLQQRDKRARAKCRVRLERLAELGHALRRPEADLLRDGIHELRVRFGTVNYRILYFFHGQGAAVLGHALTKESAVPSADVRRALRRKRAFEADPDAHTYREE